MWILLVILMLCPSLVSAQQFFYNENNSGRLNDIGAGLSIYTDEHKSGQIQQMMPGMSYYHFSNGTSGYVFDQSASEPSLYQRVFEGKSQSESQRPAAFWDQVGNRSEPWTPWKK